MDMNIACEAMIGQTLKGIIFDTANEIVVFQFDGGVIEIEGEDFGVYVEPEERH